jgi:hypothetical protein
VLLLQSAILKGDDYYSGSDHDPFPTAFKINQLAPDLTQYDYHKNKFKYTDILTPNDKRVCERK